MASEHKIEVTGLEANLLLFGFDQHFATDEQGLITNLKRVKQLGYLPEDVQKLRDKLFAIHQHPKEE